MLLLQSLLLWLAGWGGRPTPPADPASGCFSGRITYRTEYQNAAGEATNYAVPPETRFYIQGNNFKFYDHHQQLQELYLGAANMLYRFEKGRPVLVADTAARPAPGAAQCLPATAIILGHPCQLLRLVEGGVATLVFYSPEVRVDAAAFRRCAAPGWYALLQATDGALPLRTLTVDALHGYTVTSEAVAIEAREVPASEFTPDAPAR